MTSRVISETSSVAQAGSLLPASMRSAKTVRAELRRLQARLPPAIFSVVRTLEVELGWIEHGKRSCTGDSR